MTKFAQVLGKEGKFVQSGLTVADDVYKTYNALDGVAKVIKGRDPSGPLPPTSAQAWCGCERMHISVVIALPMHAHVHIEVVLPTQRGCESIAHAL